MLKLKLAIAGGAVALVAAAGIGQAQTPAPTVPVTASTTAATVSATGALGSGPTRFEVTREGSKDVGVYFILLNAGVTFEEFKAAIERDDRTGGETALGLAWIQASVALAGKETKRAVTFNLRSGQTYHVLSELDADQPRGKVRQRGFASFTTSADANGAAPPSAVRTVRMEGLRFKGASSLPRQGVVRFDNKDAAPHFALAFPLRKGVTTARLRRVLRSNNERAFGRIVAGEPYMAQGIVSGGGLTNYQEVKFPRSGRYGLVCFIYEHHALGMARVVSVK